MSCHAPTARESGGGVVVYQWVEWLRQWISERASSSNGENLTIEQFMETPMGFILSIVYCREAHQSVNGLYILTMFCSS